jgi:hypothetical protein
MRWLDWVLVAVALGSIAVMLVFYGPICGFRAEPPCSTIHYYPEGFVAYGLAVGAILVFGVRRVSRRRR